jgi:aminoglycoside phosphotransferase (APT) family kinase protein
MTAEDKSSNGDVRQVRAMARRIITHHFGNKPKRIVHQASGLSNFVFLIDHAEGDFIVRISPEPAKITAYIKEQWVMAKAREMGVPTAEVLEVGNEVVPNPYMVSRRVEGKEATAHPNPMPILREMGRFAAIINSIPTTGFGATFDWSNNQLSRNDTWKEFLHKELRLEARLQLLAKHRMLPPASLKKIRSTLEGMAKRPARAVLNHSDLRLKNVIVGVDDEIAAIIDWENSMSNIAPHWELSLALHDLSIDEKQEFLVGYGLRKKEFADVAPAIKALNIINYAPEIERLVESNDAARLEQYRTRLSGALDLYSL